MALGASPTDVMKMIVRQGMTLVIVGIAVGLGVAYALTKYLDDWMQLSALLFGITVGDPITYAAITLLLTAVAFIACYIPARRATKVDPIDALRVE
jgi:putative ABC transport system permease protein